MPVVESEDSRSASSDNESEPEARSPASRQDSPASAPDSPASGPQSPDSQRSRSRSQESNGSRSRSNTPDSRSPSPTNGFQNGSRSPRSPAGSRSSSSEKDIYPYETNVQGSRPDSPKSIASYHSGSRPHSQNSEQSASSRKQVAKSPPSSRDSSPGANKDPEEPQNVVPKSPDKNDSKQKSDSEDDNHSIKSASSKSSQKSRSSVESKKSRSSSRTSSRGSRRSRRKSESSSDSDSSVSSVDSSSRKNKDIRTVDIQPEDVSDGDMESDHERERSPHKKNISPPKSDINISHEDLSDVSDLEDSMGANSDEDGKDLQNLRSKSEAKLVQNGDGDGRDNFEKQTIEKSQSNNSRPEDGEEQLDFEAEDGECGELDAKEDDKSKDEKEEGEEDGKDDEEKNEKEEKELEEGEVTDEDDVRPEETESRPVCRFFSRGACTWGASCRFLHPGVTDKGNYTMFDMVRPMLPGEFGMGRMMDERMYGKSEQPLVESAWERGLRTAKEMLKKSMRRKEQDIDFEEKKMNLSIAQEEFDKENGYYGRIPSPEPRYVRHMPEYPVSRPPVDEYYGRRQVVYETEYPPPPRREHVRPPYREMMPHRGVPPEYFKYDEESSTRTHERMEGRERERDRERRKPKREVIVQRGPEENRPSRGDEWQDPWMRSKSPGRRKDRKKSYSSGSSSYSSSSSRSSSPSSKSSYRSRSRSTYRRGRSRSRKGGRHVSPSIIVSERKAANERAALMNPPAPKRRVPSPGMMRVSSAANPPAPSREEIFGRARTKLAAAAATLARVKSRSKRMSKSSSGSSSGSSSDSDSSESSSSSSRSNSPTVRDARKATEIVKAMDALKGNALEKNKIKLNLKNPPGLRKPDTSESRKLESIAKKRPATSPPPGDPKAKKATSRREELLKQLKAVEDAIAKKRSKV